MKLVEDFLNKRATYTGDNVWIHKDTYVGFPDNGLPGFDHANNLRCSINNRTIRIDMIIDGKSAGVYGYLQTYNHIPRGEPDQYGYYARSTEDEIIRYLNDYYFSYIREGKINKLLD